MASGLIWEYVHECMKLSLFFVYRRHVSTPFDIKLDITKFFAKKDPWRGKRIHIPRFFRFEYDAWIYILVEIFHFQQLYIQQRAGDATWRIACYSEYCQRAMMSATTERIVINSCCGDSRVQTWQTGYSMISSDIWPTAVGDNMAACIWFKMKRSVVSQW